MTPFLQDTVLRTVYFCERSELERPKKEEKEGKRKERKKRRGNEDSMRTKSTINNCRERK
jgi:hypothetical protein